MKFDIDKFINVLKLSKRIYSFYGIYVISLHEKIGCDYIVDFDESRINYNNNRTEIISEELCEKVKSQMIVLELLK
jgi:hypothetical protein